MKKVLAGIKAVGRYALPLLHVHVELPFISVTTSIMKREHNDMEFEYVMLDVRVYKWGFGIALYDTMRRAQTRRALWQEEYNNNGE